MSSVTAQLRMGELGVACNGELLRTMLGSCIGVALYDRRHKVGGLAHIVLPTANGKTTHPGKFVDTAVPSMVQAMRPLAPDELRLTAKIAGGASMFPGSVANTIGMQNIASCERLLAALGIPIVARHCGGDRGRRMSLHTTDGKVVVEIVGQGSVEL